MECKKKFWLPVVFYQFYTLFFSCKLCEMLSLIEMSVDVLCRKLMQVFNFSLKQPYYTL